MLVWVTQAERECEGRTTVCFHETGCVAVTSDHTAECPHSAVDAQV